MSELLSEVVIRGAVRLPYAVTVDRARVEVRVNDVSEADRAAVVLGETSFAAALAGAERIPFEMRIAAGPSMPRRASLSAEVRIGDPARLQRGEWVTMEAVVLPPLRPGAVIDMEVPVRRIE